MNKKQIQALINKGAVTACGLQDSKKIEAMDEQAFFDNYVGQNGLQEMRSDDDVIVEETPTEPVVLGPVNEVPELPETSIEEVIAPQADTVEVPEAVAPIEATVPEPAAEVVNEEAAPAPKKGKKK